MNINDTNDRRGPGPNGNKNISIRAQLPTHAARSTTSLMPQQAEDATETADKPHKWHTKR